VNGTNGLDGINAYTTTAAGFTVPDPAVNPLVLLLVFESRWASVGQVVYVSGAGYYQVSSIPSANQIWLSNLGYAGNTAPGTAVPTGQSISPGGIRGVAGTTGVTSLDLVSPTTTKGDLLADNGTNSPLSSLTRQGVGVDGTTLHSDSSTGTGLAWSQVDLADTTEVTGILAKANGGTSNATAFPAVATDNAVVRYDGAGGNQFQNSLLLLTDVGSLQSTPTGGNARGAAATDLQVTRSAATQVASGASATIGGGTNNTASGNYSCVPGGYNNIAPFTGGFACGYKSSAMNLYAFASGFEANATDYGIRAHAAGCFVSNGDCCLLDFMARNVTTNAVATELFLDGVPGASLRFNPGSDAIYQFDIMVVGYRTNNATWTTEDCAAWHIKGAIQKNHIGVASIVGGAVAAELIGATAGCSATWGVVGSVVVGTDLANLTITVTGIAGGDPIRWSATGRVLAFRYY
jgi:hypothetical protein